MERDAASLLDIIQAAKLIREFVAGMSREDFEDDLKTQAAVVREMEIIGEATKRLSDDLRFSHPDIPWKRMAGMRDILIHAYDAVDSDEVWNVCENSIPVLISLLEPLIADTDTE